MSDENRTIDRRSLLKLIGATGATGAVVSACGSPFGDPVSAQGLTGGKFEKTVTLATAGPGGNKNRIFPPGARRPTRWRRCPRTSCSVCTA